MEMLRHMKSSIYYNSSSLCAKITKNKQYLTINPLLRERGRSWIYFSKASNLTLPLTSTDSDQLVSSNFSPLHRSHNWKGYHMNIQTYRRHNIDCLPQLFIPENGGLIFATIFYKTLLDDHWTGCPTSWMAIYVHHSNKVTRTRNLSKNGHTRIK